MGFMKSFKAKISLFKETVSKKSRLVMNFTFYDTSIKFGTQVDFASVMIYSYKAISGFFSKKKCRPFSPDFLGLLSVLCPF